MDNEIVVPGSLPVLALKDIVIFPYMILPLYIARKESINAVDKALATNRMVLFVTQKDAAMEEVKESNLYTVGTVGQILRMVKQPDGRVKVLVQGTQRAKILKIQLTEENYMLADIQKLEYTGNIDENKAEAQMRLLKDQLVNLVNLGRPAIPEFVEILDTLDTPDKLSDVFASNMGMSIVDAQNLLEIIDPMKRLDKIGEYFKRELSILQMQQQIASSTKGEIDKNQREYYLREQLKAIKKELGEDGSGNEEIEEFSEKIKKSKMPSDVQKEADKQLKRLSGMNADSAEASVIKTYLEWLTDLPWSKSSKEILDLKRAKEILDEDHYGMNEVKERILDFLALRKLKKDLKSPILCLVGPPGVGKTSLGKSIAKALNRDFARLSFGGMRDEAEIRGHRRTYIGAMPGKIIQALKTAGTKNPVMMLDEIDKLGSDFRGDPSAALLEVLDPVQNNTFTDHYIGMPFDLSKVLFITTANYLDPIPAPLRDRMEIITLSGYTMEEKLAIAEKYIIPRQIKESGLDKYEVTFSKEAVEDIISGYTREAGLRKLEQVIATVCRKIGRQVVEKNIRKFNITMKNVEKYLGPKKFLPEEELKSNEVGIVTGLAWTPVGGEVLFVECIRYKGKGALIQTGMMGDVMRESMQAAFTYVKSIATKYNVDMNVFSEYDMHIHIPAGAIPKDGPSAGITMATAIMSVVTGRKVKKDVAMTGEITITGKVLPIGGLKEKLFAAMQIGVKTVVIPKKNEQDLAGLPDSIKKKLVFVPVEHFDEVLDVALV